MLQVIEGHSKEVLAMAFSPDGQLLATASSDTTIKIWDAMTRALRGTLEGHLNSVLKVNFSPDGQLLASSCDETVILWDIPTGMLHYTLLNPEIVSCLAFSPDSQHLVCGYHWGNIILWDTKIGTQHIVLQDNLNSTQYSTRKVEYSPDGRILASKSWDDTVKLWDPITGAVRNIIEGYTDFAFSPDS